MSVHNPNTCANPMAPLQRFRCLRPDHANVWDEHVLARDYDALAASCAQAAKDAVRFQDERDQLAAENARLREALDGCVEHMEHSTPLGRAAWEAARALLESEAKEGQA